MNIMIKIFFKRLSYFILILLAGPLSMLLANDNGDSDWRTANRKSANIAPDPMITRDAVIQVYAARAFSWRGAFATHSWIAVKPKNSKEYTVYQLIGWKLYSSKSAVVIKKDIPDRFWFNKQPRLILHKQGDGVDKLIVKIDKAAKSYPYADQYVIWPGPNSNSFISWIGRNIPELQLNLPPTAIGKDYLGHDKFIDITTSGSGYQISLFGLLGLTLAAKEGIEINIAGLVFGIDFNYLNIKLPGIGNIGLKADPLK